MSEVDLIIRLKAGDLSVLDQIYKAYAQPAKLTAYLITRNPWTAEDIVHSAFVKVMENISQLKDENSFRPWLYRIVVNLANRHMRRASLGRLLAGVFLDTGAPAVDQAVIARDEILTMRKAIATLGDTHRVPVVLRYYTGFTEQEIADILAIPLGTVKSRLHTAKEKLYREMNDGVQIIENQLSGGVGR